MTGFRRIVEFLESDDLRRALIRAYQNSEILSERDLQAFICRKLFEFLAITPELSRKYRFNAEPFCRDLNCYPDIAIFRRHTRIPHTPVIAIELKEGHSFGADVGSDCRKLLKYRRKKVRRAYLIHLAHTGSRNEFESEFDRHREGTIGVIGIGIAMREELAKQEYGKWHSSRREQKRAFGAHA